MAQHGWGGRPPASEAEARQRIIDAALACIARSGIERTTISAVANELQVTRQTVYRHFNRLSDVIAEVAAQGAESYVTGMIAHLDGVDGPAAAVVEGMLYSLRTIPNEPRLSLLLGWDDNAFGRGATNEDTTTYGAEILRLFPVDWSSVGIGDGDLEGLAELILRLLASMLQNPSTVAHSDDELRAWLWRWVAPAIGPADRAGSRP